MAADVKKIAEELVKLTVLEVNELKNVLKDEYGIEPAAAVAAVAAPAAGGAAAPAAAEEKSEFTVVLKDAGANKIQTIKVIRDITGLGLSESKALADNAPSTIKENVAKDAANEMLEKFKAAGAVAELK